MKKREKKKKKGWGGRGKDVKWKKALTAGWHKDNSRSFTFSHAENTQKRNYYTVPPQAATQQKAQEKLTLYKSRKYILPSLVLHELSTEACLDFSTRNDFKNVRVSLEKGNAAVFSCIFSSLLSNKSNSP